jgi:hypothetical protein
VSNLPVLTYNSSNGANAGQTFLSPSCRYANPADVLLDRIQLGIDVILPVPAISAVRGFCAALVRQGILAKPPGLGAELGRDLRLAPYVIPLSFGGSAKLGGRLVLTATAAGFLAVKGTSQLLPDLMRALRSQVPAPLSASRTGADNLAEEYSDHDRYAALHHVQLCTIEEVVDNLLAALANAAGTETAQLLGDVWVQQAEFCRDHYVTDAEQTIRTLAAGPIVGGATRWETHFARAGGTSTCLAWHEGPATSPGRKLYAKRNDLLRVEIVLRNRKQVTWLQRTSPECNTVKTGLSGYRLAHSLAVLARAAVAFLDAMEEIVVDHQQARQQPSIDFLVRLAPLLAVVAPAPRRPGAPGRPPAVDRGRFAREVLDALILDGQRDMGGVGASDAVLGALQAMAAAETLATSPTRPRHFSVAPQFQAARQALAGIGNWSGDDHDAFEDADYRDDDDDHRSGDWSACDFKRPDCDERSFDEPPRDPNRPDYDDRSFDEPPRDPNRPDYDDRSFDEPPGDPNRPDYDERHYD